MPSSGGKVPLRFISPICKSDSEAKLPVAFGIDPLTKVLYRKRVWSEVSSKSCEGIVPLKLIISGHLIFSNLGGHLIGFLAGMK